jgi:hypothetical protein
MAQKINGPVIPADTFAVRVSPKGIRVSGKKRYQGITIPSNPERQCERGSVTWLPSGLRLVGTLNLVVGGGATQEESG